MHCATFSYPLSSNIQKQDKRRYEKVFFIVYSDALRGLMRGD